MGVKDFATPTGHRRGIVEMSCSTDCLRKIAVVDNTLGKDGVMIVHLVLNMGAVRFVIVLIIVFNCDHNFSSRRT